MTGAKTGSAVAEVFDARHCFLGEGPLWHPRRRQLFWFDIIGNRLLSRCADVGISWQFDEHVSAAGWIDDANLLIASESRLFRFDVEHAQQQTLCVLNTDDSVRSNDGRADPQGGFWISTMHKRAVAGQGTICRLYRGELRVLFDGLSIPNSICFAADGKRAYFSDSPTHRILQVALDDEGWPLGSPDVFVDLSAEGLSPDGAVVDCEGLLWNAQWGAGRVACYRGDGTLEKTIACPAAQTSCPAFGGERFATLFVTTAREGIESPGDADGQTYRIEGVARGQAENRVVL